MKSIKTVTIEESELKRLLEKADFLDALEAAGVDSWDGYGEAQEILEEWEKEYNE